MKVADKVGVSRRRGGTPLFAIRRQLPSDSLHRIWSITLGNFSFQLSRDHEGDACHAAVWPAPLCLVIEPGCPGKEPTLGSPLDGKVGKTVRSFCVGEHGSVLLSEHDRKDTYGPSRIS